MGMKEIEILQQDKLAVSEERPVKKEMKYVGSIQPKPGHKVFELDLRYGLITPAEFISTDAHISPDGTSKVRKRLVVKEYCIYAAALNKKNAAKHFKKMMPVTNNQIG